MHEQRSTEWFEARMGCVTASRTAEVIAKTKSGYAASRANYMAELICERLTGERQGGFSSAAMQFGTQTEPQARMAYEIMTGATVVETGFVPHPEISGFGASPDGLIGDDGLIEIKCPNTATHIETLLSDKVPGKYVTQMHVQMLCTERKWCDFVSFDPRLPVDMQMFVRRVGFDEKLAKTIVEEVQKFIAEMETKIEQLKARTA